MQIWIYIWIETKCIYFSIRSSTICVCWWRTSQSLMECLVWCHYFRWLWTPFLATPRKRCCLSCKFTTVLRFSSWFEIVLMNILVLLLFSELKTETQLLGEGVQKLPGDSFEVPMIHKLYKATSWTICCKYFRPFLTCWKANQFSPITVHLIWFHIFVMFLLSLSHFY